jgi:hypothetical protein
MRSQEISWISVVAVYVVGYIPNFTPYSQRGFIVAQIMDSHYCVDCEKILFFFSLHLRLFVILLIKALAENLWEIKSSSVIYILNYFYIDTSYIRVYQSGL